MMKKKIEFIVLREGQVKPKYESFEVDLGKLSSIARFMTQNILTTDNQDDCSRLICYGPSDLSFTMMEGRHTMEQIIQRNDVWNTQDLKVSFSFHWPIYHPDKESPEEYLEEQAKAIWKANVRTMQAFVSGEKFFVNRLKQFREQKNISQQNMATLIGASLSMYTKYERGKHEPSVGNAIIIAHLLGVAVTDIWPAAYGKKSSS